MYSFPDTFLLFYPYDLIIYEKSNVFGIID